MTEKEYTQNQSDFKFIVFQGKEKIVERIFSADLFNPIIRYSVDIRDKIPSITQRLQNVMSRRNLNHIEGKYNNLKYYKDLVKFFNLDDNKLKKPVYSKYINGEKTIKGVECKFGLYINDNPIVERKIYVDNYNPACRFSSEIVEIVNNITSEIHDSLKNLDVEHMWGDYILSNIYGLYFNQIRDLPSKKRNELVSDAYNSLLVKKHMNSIRFSIIK